MRTYTANAALLKALSETRRAGSTIAFVPTMGNLHEGHLELVRKASELADIVVVSIFVNPMQFGAGEDLDAYPRTLISDKEKLFAEGVPILFAPGPGEIYPEGLSTQTQVMVPELADTLCGASRPGHFTGVATVVSKLFNIVRPDFAVFGEKDFQQLSIIRKMVLDLCLPIEIIGVATAREKDGLALSSRNGFLTRSERAVAPRLNEILMECREAIACGFDNFRELQAHAQLKLIRAGFEPDYFEIRDARTLHEVTESTEEVAILAAAKLGQPRLIDNVRLALNPVSDWGMLSSQ
ncbi:pantoate--beta-alanine ligase [Halieaceae bacterium IMCC14734]|uniref:Pantothenate synthetase n=1 Tax=Candidatus Litorirhabdus singularis TaxID=2518993 RepID=A0ABT3TL88_9GAMM|nr:pantoate--beta-alanine ligase [Candidatus Litorirhabdus singularis]MCX2983083.1 pantoate--beta-alanine ligase [Candidatus Litorirhabdus singularis]